MGKPRKFNQLSSPALSGTDKLKDVKPSRPAQPSVKKESFQKAHIGSIDYEHLEALELRGAPAIGSESTIKSSELELSVDGAAVIDLNET